MSGVGLDPDHALQLRGYTYNHMTTPRDNIEKIFGLVRDADGLRVISSDRLERNSPNEAAETLDCAKSLLVINKRLRTALPTVMFSSEVLGLLLHLFVVAKEEQVTSVGNAFGASGLPHSTGLRWVTHLRSEGLVALGEDREDQRDRMISLTMRAHELLESWLEWSIFEIAKNSDGQKPADQGTSSLGA